MKRTVSRLLIFSFLALIICGATGAQAGPSFYYVATAVDSNGIESPNSLQVSATLSQGHYTVTLTWIASVVPTGGSPIAGYNIYRSKTSGGPYTKINTAPVPGVTYSDPFVPPNAPTGVTATD